MHAGIILVWAMRLSCWPFEVEGRGAPGTDAAGPQGGESAAPAPKVETSPPAPIVPSPSLPPSLPLFEEVRYDIRYGILGSVGELTFTAGGVASGADGSRFVRVRGSGEGALLGLGGIQHRIESEFDPGTLGSRRWTTWRLRDGQKESEGTVDTGTRGNGGSLVLERLKPGEPPSRQTVTFALPTSDALGLLWRLRTAPPSLGRTDTTQLLDGLALWRVRVTTVSTGIPAPDTNRAAIRLDGDMAPISYDGRPDPDRPSRRFTLWLSDDVSHLPLRLQVPVGLGDVVMMLAEMRRLPNTDRKTEQMTDQPMGPVPGARSL